MQPHRRQPTRRPHPWGSPGKNTGVGCHFLLQSMKVKSESEVAQSCLTLSNSTDCNLPGSSIHGIFQAKSTGVGCHCLLREIVGDGIKRSGKWMCWGLMCCINPERKKKNPTKLSPVEKQRIQLYQGQKGYASEGPPWWSSGSEPVFQGRAHGFDPWSQKISHASGQPGPGTRQLLRLLSSAHGPQLLKSARTLEPVFRSKRSHPNQKPAHHSTTAREQPRLTATRGKPAQQQRPSTPKHK